MFTWSELLALSGSPLQPWGELHLIQSWLAQDQHPVQIAPVALPQPLPVAA